MGLLQLVVGFVDGLDQLGEAGRFINRPKPREAMTEQFDLTLGEQSDGNDAFLRQGARSRLICIRLNEARRLRCRLFRLRFNRLFRSDTPATGGCANSGRGAARESGNEPSAAPQLGRQDASR